MVQAQFEAETVYDAAVFAESPRWHGEAFWFSDIGAGKVCRIGPDRRVDVVLGGLDTPSGLGWLPSGELIVACIRPSTIYRVGADGIARSYFGPQDHGAIATNDMATAGERSYVTCIGRLHKPGTSGEALREPVGKILLLDHGQGECRTVAAGLRLPNGIAITPDQRSVFVSEMGAGRILKFGIEPDGSLSGPHEFARTPYAGDGICLDAEGGLWVGTTQDYFQRIDRDGREAGRVAVPGWSCVAPMLGGPDGRSLLMAAYQMDSVDAMFDGTARSRILVAQVEVPAAAG